MKNDNAGKLLLMSRPGPPKSVTARAAHNGPGSRLELIIAVEADEKNVSQLVAATGLSQPNVSHHLQTCYYFVTTEVLKPENHRK
jgi:DNA-binding transcriptional ArsR family regulator